MKRFLLILLSALLLILPCGCTAKNPMCRFGKDIQESSVLISREVFPNGCDSVVVSSADSGIALWSGTAFAGAVDAPILLFKSQSEINREVKRLGAKNVYIFGNLKYNPPKDVNCVRFSSNETVCTDSVYYLRDTLGVKYDSTFIVFSPNDAAAVAAQAYRMKAPIFLAPRTVPVPDKILYLTDKKNNYVVGKDIQIDVVLKFGDNPNRIYGHSPAEISGFANLMFDGGTESLTAVNTVTDLAYAAVFAKHSNSAVVYFDGRLYPSQDKFISEHNTNEIYSINTLVKNDMAPALKERANKVSGKTFSFDPHFKKAIFYIPHQDDETLLQSQAILGAIDAYGAENVYIVLFTDGASSRMKHSGSTGKTLDAIIQATQEKLGTAISSEDSETLRTVLFSRARDNEFYGALAHFGVKRENIRSIGLVDGQLKNSSEQVKSVMAEYKDIPDLLHMTFSPYYESHPDHMELGKCTLDTLGENAGNAYFIVRYDDDGLDKFFADEKLYNSDSREIFIQPDQNKILLASSEYGKESCDTEVISAELAANLKSGQGAAEAVRNAKSVENLRMAVGFNSVTDFFFINSTRVNSNSFITAIHKPFIK